MNNHELKQKVHSAMYTLIKKNGVVSPIEVLMEIGVLTKEKYEDWRHGRIQYLERVCQINLSKLSTINHEIRAYARKTNLKASFSDYRKWGKGNRIRLRFSKSGNEQVEKQYATHYVSQQKVGEARERKDFHKRKNEFARTIAPCGAICGLCAEALVCKGCLQDGSNRSAVCRCHECCAEKAIRGCWKCNDFPCDKAVNSQSCDVKLKAFVRCAKEDGLKGLAGHILRNQDNGIIYHRDKQNHTGDYDGLESEEDVLNLLREGKPESAKT